MLIEKSFIKNFLTNNSSIFIVMAVLFFIGFKFLLTFLFWQNRSLLPQPNDSTIYINQIESVINCPSFLCQDGYYSVKNYNGLSNLSYRLILGTFGKIFHLSAEKVFHFSFYFGFLLLPLIIYLLIKEITRDKKLIVLTILTVLTYECFAGHGFCYVTPSFFSHVIYFFLIYLLITKDFSRKTKWFLFPLLIPPFLFNHPLSYYLIATMPLFVLYFFLINKKIEKLLLIDVAIIISIVIIFYVGTQIYLSKNKFAIDPLLQTQNISSVFRGGEQEKIGPDSLQSPTKQASKKNYLPGLVGVRLGYWVVIKRFFFWPIFILILCLGIITSKKTILLPLFLSALTYTLISTTNQYGHRSLDLLWPLTFILFASGVYYGWKLSDNIKRKSLQKITKIILLIYFSYFLIFNLLFSVIYVKFQNQFLNINIQPLLLFLNKENNLNKKIYLSNKTKDLEIVLSKKISYLQFAKEKESAYYCIDAMRYETQLGKYAKKIWEATIRKENDKIKYQSECSKKNLFELNATLDNGNILIYKIKDSP